MAQIEAKLVPAVAAVSQKGLMHLPNAVREGLGLKEGEQVVFFIDSEKHRAVLVPASEGFQFPE
ncbi:MAG: AbrB/MazE/SpoVT family DNA-binding domain-containing protein [Thermoplasmata archaeon]|nr:AbrB/MazE/SpoVT family DNA-binding domain-containing protein [Thermoplasmata archaeon]MCI4359777.1 AbrB/MazE/SpoVT family DNA-binding domain-containing protein [Thermoplasmata archaeon]